MFIKSPGTRRNRFGKKDVTERARRPCQAVYGGNSALGHRPDIKDRDADHQVIARGMIFSSSAVSPAAVLPIRLLVRDTPGVTISSGNLSGTTRMVTFLSSINDRRRVPAKTRFPPL